MDAAASALCWITAVSSLDDWEPFVSGRKVALSDVRKTGFDGLLAEKIVDYLTAFERESLLKRVDRLFMLCQPDRDFEGIRGFSFDRDRLERLDSLRQRIVHHDVEESEFAAVEADLEFLFQSGLHLWTMVNAKYGVKGDVSYLMGFSGADGGGE